MGGTTSSWSCNVLVFADFSQVYSCFGGYEVTFLQGLNYFNKMSDHIDNVETNHRGWPFMGNKRLCGKFES